MIQAIDVCVNPFFPEFKDKYSRFGYWKFLDGGAYQKAQQSWTVENLIQSMDEAKVEMAGLVAFCASSPVNGEDCFIACGESEADSRFPCRPLFWHRGRESPG